MNPEWPPEHFVTPNPCVTARRFCRKQTSGDTGIDTCPVSSVGHKWIFWYAYSNCVRAKGIFSASSTASGSQSGLYRTDIFQLLKSSSYLCISSLLLPKIKKVLFVYGGSSKLNVITFKLIFVFSKDPSRREKRHNVTRKQFKWYNCCNGDFFVPQE